MCIPFHADTPNMMRKCSARDYPGPPLHAALDVADALMQDHFDLVAACDLQVGDELLMDYNVEPDDPEYYEDACRQYGVTWEWL